MSDRENCNGALRRTKKENLIVLAITRLINHCHQLRMVPLENCAARSKLLTTLPAVIFVIILHVNYFCGA